MSDSAVSTAAATANGVANAAPDETTEAATGTIIATTHHPSVVPESSVKASVLSWQQQQKFLCEQARALWLWSDDDNDVSTTTTTPSFSTSTPPTTTTTPIRSRMQRVEELYRTVWCHQDCNTIAATAAAVESSLTHGCDSGCSNTKKAKLESTSSRDTDNDAKDDSDSHYWKRHAGNKLALILLQSGRIQEADSILVALGYPCRLAASIFHYRFEPSNSSSSSSSTCTVNSTTTTGSDESSRAISTLSSSPPCHAWDNVLTQSEMSLLIGVFWDPTSDYWTFHNYTVEPPSPYFSYVLPLTTPAVKGDTEATSSSLGHHMWLSPLIHRLRQHLTPYFATLATATACEVWAHNRPHATGHQFHFDSDNEGCTGAVIRNPICSCILYVSDRSDATTTTTTTTTTTSGGGGPSVVTSQRLASRHLALTKGWLCPPVGGRVVAFDGKVLHGVVPGRCNNDDDENRVSSADQRPPRRRVSVMLAFWKTIRVRSDPSGRPGAARRFPTTLDQQQQQQQLPTWARLVSNNSDTNDTIPTPTRVHPIPIGHVYESTRDGKPWTRQDGMLDYEDIYQGF